ncbi:MAG TPA: class I SAM-dependent methyltransferase [Thermotogota bacterium]|nr:class I SAM-dependent methyltransferase [Thermotogota bacterium]
MEILLKDGLELQEKNNINYVVRDGELLRYQPWTGGVMGAMYDSVMRGSVFPRKFGADYFKHYDILKDQLSSLENKKILEIGTGTGLLCNFLHRSNCYYGSDVSDGLLKKALKVLKKKHFKESLLFHCSGDDLPFENDQFDIILCNLTMNLFPNTDLFLSEVQRTLKLEGGFFCSVPVLDRKRGKGEIEGKLFSEDTLKELFYQKGFFFSTLHYQNGAVFYFVARKQIPGS